MADRERCRWRSRPSDGICSARIAPLHSFVMPRRTAMCGSAWGPPPEAAPKCSPIGNSREPALH